MCNRPTSTARRFTSWERWALLALGVLLLGLLSTAAVLEPNPEGFGTHQQLGLGQCTAAMLIGRPCPTCGMTTSWAWVMRAELFQAASVNLGGTITAIVALLMAPWALASATAGRWWPLPLPPALVVTTAITVGLVTLIDWYQRCW